ncbi:NuA4 histone acetyltransferase subunit [Ascosphaera atra]|nr:NuA4 histone acetyltransferase subunit [Ascosphaera atra]
MAEVNAIILDPGYNSTRAGFAGEDTPKAFMTSCYGAYPSDSGNRFIYGDDVYVPRPKLSVTNPMSTHGWVEDWDMAEKVWEHAIRSRLMNPKETAPRFNGLNDNPESAEDMDVEMADAQEKMLDDTPLLMTESAWNPTEKREKIIEIAMEHWGTPAFYLARAPQLTTFSAGKASALVIDVGASTTSVVPVHDGLVLRKGIQYSHLAGEFISSQARTLFNSRTPTPLTLTPQYLVASKITVDPGQPAQITVRQMSAEQSPTETFRRFHEDRMLTEFKESVARFWPGPHSLYHTEEKEGPSNFELAKKEPGRPFEFPDGYNEVFDINGYRITEPLFDANATVENYSDLLFPKPTPEQTIPELIRASLNAVDVDVRPHLLNNVVVTGATTLIPGFNDRLNNELVSMFPSPRVRLHAPGNTAERRFSAWIGGSILASLGTFHQMWISKKEYDEHGPGIVDKRCK